MIILCGSAAILMDRSQCLQIESSTSSSISALLGSTTGFDLGSFEILNVLKELPDVVKVYAAEDDNEVVVYADDNIPLTAENNPIHLESKSPAQNKLRLKVVN